MQKLLQHLLFLTLFKLHTFDNTNLHQQYLKKIVLIFESQKCNN